MKHPSTILLATLSLQTSAWTPRSSLPQPRTISTPPLHLNGGISPPNDLITTLVPRVGILTSTLLYFSPLLAVRSALAQNDIGSLNPFPLAIMAVSSLSWLVYGLAIRDPHVTLSNVPGFVVSIWYVTAVLPLLKGRTLTSTRSLLVILSACTVHLWTYLSLTHAPIPRITTSLGLFASFLFLILCGSPLSSMKTVIQSRDSSSILVSLTLAQVVNTALWSGYGWMRRDGFVWGPNLVGLVFGIVQLVLKIWFRGE